MRSQDVIDKGKLRYVHDLILRYVRPCNKRNPPKLPSAQLSPKQNAPSPTLQKLHVMLTNIRVTSLDPSAELFDALLDSSGNSDVDLV